MSTTSAHPTTARRSEQFHALSDETRLQILGLLRGGEHCVCELTEALDLGQSLLSFHLKTLRDAGLVTDRREGRWMYYSLAPETLDALATHLTGLKRPVAPQRRRAARCKEPG